MMNLTPKSKKINRILFKCCGAALAVYTIVKMIVAMPDLEGKLYLLGSMSFVMIIPMTPFGMRVLIDDKKRKLALCVSSSVVFVGIGSICLKDHLAGAYLFFFIVVMFTVMFGFLKLVKRFVL